MNTKASPLSVYLVGALGIVIWGASPAATKLAVQSFSGWEVAILRTFLAALLILPYTMGKRPNLPQTRTDWWTLAAVSVVGTILYAVLFSIGIAMTSTIHAALIIASAPIFTGLIGFSLNKGWPHPIWWGGALVAFVGECWLIFSTTHTAQGATLEGDLLILAAIICVSAGYVAGGRLSASIGTWAATSWSLFFSGILLGPAFVYMLFQVPWQEITTASWLGLGYLVIFICILGYICWYWAIAQMGVGPIAPLQFAQPIVSISLGILLFDETLDFQIIGATAIILCGIVLTKKA